MRAIVLSGGGARGAYEIGVWKALRKLRIKYDIVTGSSVGSLNGAMMVQNHYYRAIRLWKKINFQTIFDNQFDKKQNFYKEYAKFYFGEGISINRFHKLLEKYVNLDKFYNSKINFGLSTVRLSDFKPLLLTKKQIKKEKLIDYLVASSTCYPFFPIKEIDNQKFIDGGFYDNMPINLAIDMGATEVIAIDLNTIGSVQKPKSKDIPITYIKSHNNIGSPYDFNAKNASRAIKYGYNDAMKVFGKLEGNKLTFKYNHLENNFRNLKEKYMNNFKESLKYQESLIKLFEKPIYKKLVNGYLDQIQFDKILENSGLIFELDQTKIYSIQKYNKKLLTAFNNYEEIKTQINVKNKKVFDQKAIIKKIYGEIEKNRYTKLRTWWVTFPNEFLCAIYIYTINL